MLLPERKAFDCIMCSKVECDDASLTLHNDCTYMRTAHSHVHACRSILVTHDNGFIIRLFMTIIEKEKFIINVNREHKQDHDRDVMMNYMSERMCERYLQISEKYVLYTV